MLEERTGERNRRKREKVGEGRRETIRFNPSLLILLEKERKTS